MPLRGNTPRDVGLGLRATAEGVASIPGLIYDPLAAGWERLTGIRQPGLVESVGGLLDMAGVPRPETPRERVMTDVGRGISGTAVTLGTGTALSQAPGMAGRVGRFFAANPVAQTVGSATGAGSAGIVRENGGSGGQQFAAAMIGGMGPGFAVSGGQAALRGAVRGGEAGRRVVEDNIRAFRAAGTTPTVGQATEGHFARGMESTLARLPGSAGRVAAKATAQGEDIGTSVNSLARQLSPKANPTTAGRAIEQGIKGEGGFVQTTKAVSDKLYNELDRAIPAGTRVDVSATREALARLNAGIPGAPSLSRFFQSAKLQGIDSALVDDTSGLAAVQSRPGASERVNELRQTLTQKAESIAAENSRRRMLGLSNFEPVPTRADIDGQIEAILRGEVDNRLPYEALKKLRTLVGQELENVGLVSDVPRSKWKEVYSALTKDLEQAAGTSPEAKQAWSRANTYYRARMDRLDMIESVVERAGGPEKVFNAATSGTREGATTLRAVMQSLPQDAQRQVSASVLRRMGRATDGQQDDLGNAFSVSTFLTNWNKLSPEARGVLFNRYGSSYRMHMDQIAKVAANLREGSRVFANPSGTAAATAQIGGGAALGGTVLSALFTGNWAAPGVVLGGAGLANVTARLMTSPRFVQWLARNTQAPVGVLNTQAPLIRQIADESGDEELASLADQLEAQNGRREMGNGQVRR